MSSLAFYQEIARRLGAGEKLVMATVVDTKGSAPREPGAQMAVTAEGNIIGTVGGGYPEFETVKAAKAVLEEGRSRAIHIEMTAEISARVGAICGGVMDVFVEPLAQPVTPPRH